MEYIRNLMIPVLMLSCLSCDADTGKKVTQLGFSPEIRDLATSGSVLIGANRREISVWSWDNLNAEPMKVEIDNRRSRLTASKRLLRITREQGVPPVKRDGLEDMRILESGKRIICSDSKNLDSIYQEWTPGKDWYCDSFEISSSGRFAVFEFRESVDTAFDRCVDIRNNIRTCSHGERRLGFYDDQDTSLKWIVTFDTVQTGPQVSSCAVSEDGKLVAASGCWERGWLLLADVAQEKELWVARPSWSINFNDVCFSPDAKTIYIAGNGGVYLFDVSTGEVTGVWQMPNRCVGVAASPDGKLVAGGLGPCGRVFIYDARTGQELNVLHTGQYTTYGLAFSPDSSRLATSGVKETGIRIWQMPKVPASVPVPPKSNKSVIPEGWQKSTQ